MSITDNAVAGWNFAEVFEALAERFPDAPAQVQGERRSTWAEFDRAGRRRRRRAARRRASPAATRSRSTSTTVPSTSSRCSPCSRSALVPVNTNYRYAVDEIVYLWDNADAVGGGVPRHLHRPVERVRGPVPRRPPLAVGGRRRRRRARTGPLPYEAAAASATARTAPPGGRSGDDLYMLYTGGTTGMPKGVMWRQDDLIRAERRRIEAPPSGGGRAGKRSPSGSPKPGFRTLPAAPLMHGTGAFSSFGASCPGRLRGDCSRAGRSTPIELLDTIERERVNSISIVGDAFAKPILRALDAEPGRWDIASLRVIISSGMMFSQETKQGLLAPPPGADAGRRVRLVGGDRDGPVDHERDRLGVDCPVPPRAEPRG